MTDLTDLLTHYYAPTGGFVFYKQKGPSKPFYIESFSIDSQGTPINFHPLSKQEVHQLANLLQQDKQEINQYLRPKGLLPDQVLWINPSPSAPAVIWYSPAQKQNLLFVPELDIRCGTAYVPPLVWKATVSQLSVFALHTAKKPSLMTPLYHAPFFNIFPTGAVCMGSVRVRIDGQAGLETFMRQWEGYFFASYFSHLIHQHQPVREDITTLWNTLIHTQQPFPVSALKKMNLTLSQLLS